MIGPIRVPTGPTSSLRVAVQGEDPVDAVEPPCGDARRGRRRAAPPRRAGRSAAPARAARPACSWAQHEARRRARRWCARRGRRRARRRARSTRRAVAGRLAAAARRCRRAAAIRRRPVSRRGRCRRPGRCPAAGCGLEPGARAAAPRRAPAVGTRCGRARVGVDVAADRDQLVAQAASRLATGRRRDPSDPSPTRRPGQARDQPPDASAGGRDRSRKSSRPRPPAVDRS